MKTTTLSITLMCLGLFPLAQSVSADNIDNLFLADDIPKKAAGSIKSKIHSGVELYSDSDDLEINKLSIGYRHGHDIFNYLHEAEAEKEWLWSLKTTHDTIKRPTQDNYKGSEYSASVAQKINKQLSAEVGLGHSELKNKRTGITDQLTSYSAKAKLAITDKLVVHAKQERQYLFDHAIIESDSGKLVHGDTSDLGLYWRAHDKWRVQGNILKQGLSDGNDSQKISGAVLYGISSGWPWIWTGIKAEKLEYDEQRASYWTPADYQSYGLTLDSSFPVSKDLSMSLGANFNRSKEDNNPSGTGYSVSAGADWKVAENISLKATGYLLESTQETSEWKQDGINLSVNMKAF